MNNLIPVKMSYTDLADLLSSMASLIRSGRSFDGFIEYQLPDPTETSTLTTEVMVRGSYRIGNSDGQGGVRIIGTIPGI